MLASIQRHPVPIEAFFRYSLVLTYAFPEAVLKPLLPSGLMLDTYEGDGFLAIALVQTEQLRPAGLPAFLGRNFFLSGYRIFCRFQRTDGKVLRGLRILRSDTDSGLMAFVGNLLTHYHYRKCLVETRRTQTELAINIRTPRGEADLSLFADLGSILNSPPAGSPFPDLPTARHFAGPLPYTFDFEPESGSMVIIEGVRQHWLPKPISVRVDHCGFLDRPPFQGTVPRLANSFLVENVPYRWKRGVLEHLTPGIQGAS